MGQEPGIRVEPPSCPPLGRGQQGHRAAALLDDLVGPGEIIDLQVGGDRQLARLVERELGGLEVIPGEQPPVSDPVEIDILPAEQTALLQRRHSLARQV